MSAYLHQNKKSFAKPSYEELVVLLEEAREEIRNLRQGITPALALPSFLNIHKKQQALVLTLYQCSPRIIPHSRLLELVYPDGDEPDPSHVTAMIYKARKILQQYGIHIKTEYGIGRYMPLESRDILKNYIETSIK